MLSPTLGWAVGDLGTIMSWNGLEWTLVQSPTTKNLYSVVFPDVSNPNDGWIVSQTDTLSTGVFPTILHWDGVAWVRLDTSNGLSWTGGQVGDLWSMSFLSPSDGWAVGAPGTVAPMTSIVHWSGRWGAGGYWTWKLNPDTTSTFYSVQVLSNTATPVGGYAIGGCRCEWCYLVLGRGKLEYVHWIHPCGCPSLRFDAQLDRCMGRRRRTCRDPHKTYGYSSLGNYVGRFDVPLGSRHPRPLLRPRD